MNPFLISTINLLVNAITLVVIVDVIFSWFLPPYHPARDMLDRLLNPLLQPIRRLIPSAGGIDFSPMILLIAVQLLGNLLVSLLAR